MGPINPTPSKSQDVQSNDNSVSQVDFKKLYDIVVDSVADNTGQPEDGYDYDPIEDLRLQFEQLGVNQAMARVIHAVFKKSSKHSSNSGASSSDNDSNTGVSSDSDGPESESENITEIVQNIINTAKAKKSEAKEKSKTRKTKQGEKITSSDKGRNSGANLMENLKANIKNSSNIVAPIQKQSFKSPNQPDFRNY
ncbi:3065_t:CDS:2 [Entrophospora sp. SA101]|nr:3065_t:CDS:2 [Entrophospora sp. SA101]